MSWIWSALMPHPPVLIHEIGRGREIEATKTLNGINELTSKLEKPDLLLVLSPHQPYVPWSTVCECDKFLSRLFCSIRSYKCENKCAFTK